MRYETNAFIRSVLVLLLTLVLGGGVSVAMADSHKEKKQGSQECSQQSGQECKQKEDGNQGEDDGGYGDFDPTKSFGSALSDDSGNEEKE